MAQKLVLGIHRVDPSSCRISRFMASKLISLGHKNRVNDSGALLGSCNESRISDVCLLAVSVSTCLCLGFWGYKDARSLSGR